MAKAAKTTAAPNTESAAPEAAAFDVANMPDPAQVLDNMRKLAEEGLAKTKTAYEQAKTAMEEAQKDMQAGAETAKDHGSKMSMAAIEAMRANTENTFSMLEKMVGVKSISEAFELQTEFLRKQAEMTVDGAKDMQAMAKSAAEDMTKPMKEAAEKAMKNFKA